MMDKTQFGMGTGSFSLMDPYQNVWSWARSWAFLISIISNCFFFYVFPLGFFPGKDGGSRTIFSEEQEEWIWSPVKSVVQMLDHTPAHCPSPTFSWISFLFRKLRNNVMYWIYEEINIKKRKSSKEKNVHYYGNDKEKLWLM